MPSADLATFLFEIASNERLALLEAVLARPRKHTELTRTLDLTGSETTRHLSRLVAAGLVEKTGNGEYAPTPLARALWAGLPYLDFLATHRAFVATHDLTVLEPSFVARLGDLARGSFRQGAYEVVAVQEAALRGVRRRAWVLTVQRFEQALPILRAKMSEGVDVRVIRPRDLVEAERRDGRDVERNFPFRLLPDVRFFLAVLDDTAGLCLPSLDGRLDMATMVFLADAAGYRWAEELFLRSWDRGREPPEGARPRGRAGR
ncbi:MAG TPA: ArsR family transcriptional regulator [Thermoplasmata archaeon]|nr:ArsR family transcriptional regulator [Thermoplasmata archaeon]